MKRRSITIRVQRFDPAAEPEPRIRSYRVPCSPGMSVSDALRLVNERSGDALAYLVSCRQGVCGCCLVKVNGQPRLACCTPVDGDIIVEPAFPSLVIKDLVTGKGTWKSKLNEKRRSHGPKI